MYKDNIEAPWVGNDDYDKHEVITTQDYDFYWQDDLRKEQEIEEALRNERTRD